MQEAGYLLLAIQYTNDIRGYWAVPDRVGLVRASKQGCGHRADHSSCLDHQMEGASGLHHRQQYQGQFHRSQYRGNDS